MTRSMSKAIAERKYGTRRRDRHEFTDAELDALEEVSDNPQTDWIDSLLNDPWTGSATLQRQWTAVEARNRAMAAAATEVMAFDTLRVVQDDLRRQYATAYGPITIGGGEINETIHIR